MPTTEQAGAETRARELIAGMLARSDLEFEIAYYREGRAHARFEDLGIPLRRLGFSSRLAVDLPRLAWRLSSLYAKAPPGLVHSWLTNGNLVALLAARRWPRTGVIITQCGGRGEEVYMRRRLQLQRALIKRADHAISNSSEGAEVLARWGMAEDEISVIGNGIAPDRVTVRATRTEIRERIGIPNEAPLVTVALRANDRFSFGQKNLTGLVAAMEDVRRSRPDARLIIVGTSADELAAFGLALPAWAKALGFVDRPADFLDASDVVALASNAEGTSNVACEALMLGLPVATTDVGDHGRIVTEAGGRTVATGDMTALASSISELIADPPDRQRVREVANRRLGIERMVEATEAVYSRVLASAGERRGLRRIMRGADSPSLR